MRILANGQYFDVDDERFQDIAKAILPSDIETATLHLVDFAEAITNYGTYETPLSARLRHVPATAVQHYYGDRAVAGGTTVNAQADNFTLTTIAETVDSLPVRRSNTCQILARLAAVGGSAYAEAIRGGVIGIDDLMADQRGVAISMLLKDLEYSLVSAVESTTSPRQMEGLKKWITDNSGSNYYSGAAAAFDETMLVAFLENIRDRKTGYFPDSIYCSGRILRKIASWTADRVNFTIDISRMDEAMQMLGNLGAGQAAAFYTAPDGHILKLFYHPNIAHSGTAGSNFLLALCEPLIAIAELRPMQIVPAAQTTDGRYEVVLLECTIEVKVPAAHGCLYNWTAA